MCSHEMLAAHSAAISFRHSFGNCMRQTCRGSIPLHNPAQNAAEIPRNVYLCMCQFIKLKRTAHTTSPLCISLSAHPSLSLVSLFPEPNCSKKVFHALSMTFPRSASLHITVAPGIVLHAFLHTNLCNKCISLSLKSGRRCGRHRLSGVFLLLYYGRCLLP